jgi:L-arabinose isomerase
MASSPGALVEVLDAYPDVPVVLWAAHDGPAVDPDISHSGITERGGTVGIPMIGAHLTRTGRAFDVVASDLSALDVIGPAVIAAAAAGVVRRSRLGIVGTPIPGYEWARVPTATLERYGITAVERPVDALAERLAVAPSDDADLDHSALDGFAIAPDVTEADLGRALRYAAALESLVADESLDAGTLNCHVPALRLGIGSAPCLALGACTTRGVPWTCTGDVATALAMLLVTSLGAPTLYHEIEALDEVSDEAILANSGEHDARFATADPKRIIVNPWFDRSPATASAEFTIAPGPASLVGIATQADGSLTVVVAPGRITARTSHDSGTANAAFVFASGPIAQAWRRWSLAGVGHHSCATDRDLTRELEALSRHLGFGFVTV